MAFRFVDGPISPSTFSKGKPFPKFRIPEAYRGNFSSRHLLALLPPCTAFGTAVFAAWQGKGTDGGDGRQGCSCDTKSTKATNTSEAGSTGPSSRFFPPGRLVIMTQQEHRPVTREMSIYILREGAVGGIEPLVRGEKMSALFLLAL